MPRHVEHLTHETTGDDQDITCATFKPLSEHTQQIQMQIKEQSVCTCTMM